MELFRSTLHGHRLVHNLKQLSRIIWNSCFCDKCPQFTNVYRNPVHKSAENHQSMGRGNRASLRPPPRASPPGISPSPRVSPPPPRVSPPPPGISPPPTPTMAMCRTLLYLSHLTVYSCMRQYVNHHWSRLALLLLPGQVNSPAYHTPSL